MISHPERYKGGISPQATNIHPQPDTPLVGGSSDKLAEQKKFRKKTPVMCLGRYDLRTFEQTFP